MLTDADARHWTETELVAPPLEPVTLNQVKHRLRITHAADDVDLQLLIVAARRQVEHDTSAVLVKATIAQTVHAPASPTAPVLLMRWPVQTIESVTAYDESGSPTVIPATAYRLAPGKPARLEVVGGATWPAVRARDGLTIVYVAGFGGSIPIDVSSLTATGSTFTATTAQPHGFIVGQRILIDGADQAVYNNLWTIAAVPNPTTFTWPRTGGGTPPAAATGAVTATVLGAPEDLRLAVLALVGHWHDPLRSGLTTDGEQYPLPYGYADLTRDRLEWLP
jgi:uncharacterized phiE125 gp8 family phage protein